MRIPKFKDRPPIDILVVKSKVKSNYCKKNDHPMAQVAVRGEGNKYLTGAICLKCVNEFLPEDVKLVPIKI